MDRYGVVWDSIKEEFKGVTYGLTQNGETILLWDFIELVIRKYQKD
jgi:hypothetical protein